MGEGWARRTSGRVRHCCRDGRSEEEMVRNLRITRTLQGAQLSAISLGRLDDAFNVFGLPMFFESYDEVDAVL